MYCTGEALPGSGAFSGATSLPDTREMGLLMWLLRVLFMGDVALSFDLPDRVGYTSSF